MAVGWPSLFSGWPQDPRSLWQCGHEGSEMGFPVCCICVPGKHFISCTVPPFCSTGLEPERKRRRDRSCPTSRPQMTDLWTLMPRPVSMLGFCCLECLLQIWWSSIADQLKVVTFPLWRTEGEGSLAWDCLLWILGYCAEQLFPLFYYPQNIKTSCLSK